METNPFKLERKQPEDDFGLGQWAHEFNWDDEQLKSLDDKAMMWYEYFKRDQLFKIPEGVALIDQAMQHCLFPEQNEQLTLIARSATRNWLAKHPMFGAETLEQVWSKVWDDYTKTPAYTNPEAVRLRVAAERAANKEKTKSSSSALQVANDAWRQAVKDRDTNVKLWKQHVMQLKANQVKEMANMISALKIKHATDLQNAIIEKDTAIAQWDDYARVLHTTFTTMKSQ